MPPFKEGIFQISSSGTWTGRWSLLWFSQSDGWQTACFICYLGAALLFVCTRKAVIVSLLAWVFHLSISARAPSFNNAGDSFLRLLLLWNLLIGIERWLASRTPKESIIKGVAVTGLYMQVAFLYWIAAVVKSHPVWREDFTAVHEALQLGSLRTPLGGWLVGFPGLCQIATRATLILEEAGPFFLFLPLRLWRVRMWVIIIFMAFHLCLLAPAMNLGLFPYVCASAWTIFLPSEFWRWLRQFHHLAWLEPAHEAEYLRLREGWKRLLAAVGLLGIRSVSSVAIAYLCVWNFSLLLPPKQTSWFTMNVQAPGIALGLKQRWALFAARPSTRDGWMLAPAKLASGIEIDLFTGLPPLRTLRVGEVASAYRSFRWRKHLGELFRTPMPRERAALHAYLVRRWNEQSAHDPVKESKLVFRYYDRLHLEDGLLEAVIDPPPLSSQEAGFPTAKSLPVPSSDKKAPDEEGDL